MATAAFLFSSVTVKLRVKSESKKTALENPLAAGV